MSDWSDLYPQPAQPTPEDISAFISNPIWEDLNAFLQTAYTAVPRYSYSKCSAAPGWNVKYQKGGRALCTLYPMSGYFITLIVIGERESVQTELALPFLTEYVRTLYTNAPVVMGGKWLMIEVRSAEVLQDVRSLIGLRCPPAKK